LLSGPDDAALQTDGNGQMIKSTSFNAADFFVGSLDSRLIREDSGIAAPRLSPARISEKE